MGRDERSNPFNRFAKTEALSVSQTYDRFGRPLQEGDIIHLLGKLDIMWRVVSVKPILNPKAPPGTIEIQLHAVFVTGVPGGQLVTDVIKVKDASEFAQPAGQADGDPGDGESVQ
jgi:hypothetical protein